MLLGGNGEIRYGDAGGKRCSLFTSCYPGWDCVCQAQGNGLELRGFHGRGQSFYPEFKKAMLRSECAYYKLPHEFSSLVTLIYKSNIFVITTVARYKPAPCHLISGWKTMSNSLRRRSISSAERQMSCWYAAINFSTAAPGKRSVTNTLNNCNLDILAMVMKV